jgi:preprotein translocase subunit SecE
MKTGIELILDEKLKELEEIKKEESFTRQIQEVHQEIKKVI